MAEQDAKRLAIVQAGNAEVECQKCQWLGSEDEACIDPPPSARRTCPECGSHTVHDYESVLYKIGYR